MNLPSIGREITDTVGRLAKMSTKLKLDLPVNVNDMTDSATGQIIIAVKKLVDDLNFVLSNINTSNLGKELKNKLDTIENDISALKEGGDGNETS